MAQLSLQASVRNIVIVHGALADGSGWRKATENLVDRDFNVTIVQEPITSLTDDVTATNRVLDLQDGRRSSLATATAAWSSPRRATRVSSEVTEIAASHAVFVSQPEIVADVIEKAAKALSH